MPMLSLPTPTHVTAAAVQRVFINGWLRGDVWCRAITDSLGIQPGVAQFTFPAAQYDEMPTLAGAYVEVWIGGFLKFRGWIDDESAAQNATDWDNTVTARDIRSRLGDFQARRSYNMPDDLRESVLEGGVAMTTRAIIWDLLRQFNWWTRNYHGSTGSPGYVEMQFDSYSIPDNERPGNVAVEGMPIAQALETVLSMCSVNAALRINYNRLDGRILEAISFPDSSGSQQRSGGIARIARGVDPSVDWVYQPYGIPSALPARQVSHSQMTNMLRVVGSPALVETVVPCHVDGEIDGRAWDDAGDHGPSRGEVLAAWEKYTTEPTENLANPDYTPWAKWVGTRYAIPKLNVVIDEDLGRTAEIQVAILPNLLRPEFAGGESEDRRMAPFALVRWPGEVGVGDDYQVYLSDSFTIQDNRWLVFKKPLVAQVTQVDGSGYWYLPSEVWLNIAFAKTFGLSHIEGPSGTANFKLVQMATVKRPEFRHEALVYAASLVNVPVPQGSTHPAWGLQGPALVSATLIDDSSSIQSLRSTQQSISTWARNRLRQMQDPVTALTYICQRGEPGYVCGQRIYDNGWDTRSLIVQTTMSFGPEASAPDASTVLQVQSAT